MSRRSIRMESAAAFAAAQVGRWCAHRDHWLHEARRGEPALRSLHVTFARNAHHEAMRFLKQVPTRHA